MKTKRIIALIVTLVMLMAALAACGTKPETTAKTDNAPAKGSIQIKYSTWAGEGEAAYEGMKKFKELIEAESNGVIEVLLYPSDQAGSTIRRARGCRGRRWMPLCGVPSNG